MVPMRAIFEWLGATVNYDAESHKIAATRGSTTVQLAIGEKTASVTSTPIGKDVPKLTQPILLDAPPVERHGRTFVPLRFAAEAFGAAVAWHEATQTATVCLDGREGTVTIGRTTPRQTTASKEKTQSMQAAGIVMIMKLSALLDISARNGLTLGVKDPASTKPIDKDKVYTPKYVDGTIRIYDDDGTVVLELIENGAPVPQVYRDMLVR